MGRKNNRRGRPQVQRRGATPPPSLDTLVIPVGRCYRNSRRGKLRFKAADAERALSQAQATRWRQGNTGHREERVYECLVSEGGCGDWHLTSRTTYTPRSA